jgi:hypothetical protein
MKFVAVIISAGMLAIVAAVAPVTVNFDNVPAGQPPAGWTATKTGSDEAKWTVERDDTAPTE